MNLCSMPYEDCEPCEMWREGIVVVRKPQRCCECGAKISPGERAGRASGKYHGTWETWHRCQACVILSEMVGTIAGECPLWGGLDPSIDNLNDGFFDLESQLPSPREHREQWESLPAPSPGGE